MNSPIKNTNTISLTLLILFAVLSVFTACKDDDVDDPVEPINQNENPSHVRIAFVNMANLNDTVYARWNDADGIAGTTGAITIDSIKLNQYSDYKMHISVENRTVNPVINLTNEISAEKNVHQFFFKPSPMSLLTVDNLDVDTNNLPFGLNAQVHTVTPGSGTFQIDLDHYDEVAKSGTNRSGSTDISITFPVKIE
jgi:hypothetical protein